ncbi:hypothetical protein Trydic_g8209 [Trypoxylus dichotomus]
MFWNAQGIAKKKNELRAFITDNEIDVALLTETCLKVPLYNTITRRIYHIAQDLNDHLVNKLNGTEFDLQCDKATDSNKDAHLICYVPLLDDNIIIKDLFCKSIIGSTKTQDLFEMLEIFITGNGLGCKKLQALIRSIAPHNMSIHCAIYRESLVLKLRNS